MKLGQINVKKTKCSFNNNHLKNLPQWFVIKQATRAKPINPKTGSQLKKKASWPKSRNISYSSIYPCLTYCLPFSFALSLSLSLYFRFVSFINDKNVVQNRPIRLSVIRICPLSRYASFIWNGTEATVYSQTLYKM